ncbi:MAG: PAS domain S-box protein [Calditrichaceae bacterium]
MNYSELSKEHLIAELIKMQNRLDDLEELELEYRSSFESLKSGEARYRNIVEDQTELICRFQHDGTITFANDTYCKTFNRTRAEMIGSKFFPDIPEEERRMVKNVFKKLNPENPIVSYVHRVVLDSGEIRWHHWTLRLILGANNQVKEYQAVGLDITTLKKTEKELQFARDQLRAVIDAVPGLITWVDKDLKYIGANQFFANIFNIKPEDIVGRSVGFSGADSEYITFVIEFFKNFENTGSKETVSVLNGRKYIHLIEAQKYNNGNGAVFVGIDITEIRSTQKELDHRIRFEKLITSISTRFINLPPEKIDRTIEDSLREIGEFAGIDRSYVFLFTDDGKYMENTHEWCADGIEPEIGNLQKIPVKNYKWWMRKLNKFQHIHIPDVDKLPPEAEEEKKILQAQNIQSLIVLPMRSGSAGADNPLVGFLGFDHVKSINPWSEESIALLTVLGELIVNVIERNKMTVALAQARKENEILQRELHQSHSEIKLLNDLSGLLETCTESEDVFLLLRNFLIKIIPDTTGALYLLSDSETIFYMAVEWGDDIKYENKMIMKKDCWALKRLQPHKFSNPESDLACKHVTGDNGHHYFCIPMIVQGELMGLFHLRRSFPKTGHIKGTNNLLNESDLQLARALAGHISVILNNLSLKKMFDGKLGKNK